VSLRENQTVAEAARLLAKNDLRGAPVLCEEGILQGVLTQADIDQVPRAQRDQRQVKEVMKRAVLVLPADEALDEALEEPCKLGPCHRRDQIPNTESASDRDHLHSPNGAILPGNPGSYAFALDKQKERCYTTYESDQSSNTKRREGIGKIERNDAKNCR
jgi:hypothetical protein